MTILLYIHSKGILYIYSKSIGSEDLSGFFFYAVMRPYLSVAHGGRFGLMVALDVRSAGYQNGYESSSFLNICTKYTATQPVVVKISWTKVLKRLNQTISY